MREKLTRSMQLVFVASLFLPIAELLALRIWLHSYLDFRPGLPGFVDYDLVLPVPLAWAAFLWLSRDLGWNVRFAKRSLFINILFVAFFVGSCLLSSTDGLKTPLSTLIFWSLAVGVALSATDVFFPVQQIFRRQRLLLLAVSAVAGLSLVILKGTFSYQWTQFERLSADTSCAILTSVSKTGGCQWFQDGHLLIFLGSISAFIGSHCAGGDAMVLMICCLILFSAKKGPAAGGLLTSLAWLVGLIFAFGMNQFRILFMLVSASYLSEVVGPVRANHIFLSLFHIHTGWILYAIGLAVYFALWSYAVEFRRKAALVVKL
jgi:hypothetical protein